MAHCVFNATNEKQVVHCLGNYFEFSPKQVKWMNSEDLVRYLGTERGRQGMVAMSEAFDDPEFRKTPEGLAELQAAEINGISHRVEYLRGLIYNETVALQLDLQVANLKIDPATLMSKEMLENLKALAGYQKTKDDADAKQADEVRKLLKQTGEMSK